jgi:two-component system CheB/CheR fusion protein
MKAGAVDFIQKPFKSKTLYASIETALFNAERLRQHFSDRATPATLDYHFTNRQCEILKLVLDGQPSKNIAADLGISQRTVENHRAAIMKKTNSRSIPGLVRATQNWVPTVV